MMHAPLALAGRFSVKVKLGPVSALSHPPPAPAANRASTLRPSGSSDSVLSDSSLLDVTSLTSDLSASSLSLDSARETTSPEVAAFSDVTVGEGASSVCVSTPAKMRMTHRILIFLAVYKREAKASF